MRISLRLNLNIRRSSNEHKKKRMSRMITCTYHQPPEKPKRYIPVPEKKPIDVQEQLKIGALQLKQEVDSLLTLYGGTFNPGFISSRNTLSQNNSIIDTTGSQIGHRFVSPQPRSNNSLQGDIMNLKHNKSSKSRNQRENHCRERNNLTYDGHREGRTISHQPGTRTGLKSSLAKVPEEEINLNKTMKMKRDFKSPIELLQRGQTVITRRDKIRDGHQRTKNDLHPPMVDIAQFPKRKSKFLKMLKRYTADKYSKNCEEPKSPAIESLQKAREDLKEMTKQTKTKAEFLNRIKERIGQSGTKKVYKAVFQLKKYQQPLIDEAKKLSELVENSQNMNKKRETKFRKLQTKKLSESFSDGSSEDNEKQNKKAKGEVAPTKKTRKVVADFYVHRKSRASIINQETNRKITKVRQLKRGSIIFGKNKKKFSPEEVKKQIKGDNLEKPSNNSSRRPSKISSNQESNSRNI